MVADVVDVKRVAHFGESDHPVRVKPTPCRSETMREFDYAARCDGLLGSMKLGSKFGVEHRVAHASSAFPRRSCMPPPPPPAGLLVADESEH